MADHLEPETFHQRINREPPTVQLAERLVRVGYDEAALEAVETSPTGAVRFRAGFENCDLLLWVKDNRVRLSEVVAKGAPLMADEWRIIEIEDNPDGHVESRL